MPGGDGLSFCRALKADPDRRDIPVVILSGGEADWATALADAFLQKPFSVAQLTTIVRDALDDAPAFA